MKNYQYSVAEFQIACSQPVNKVYTKLSQKSKDFRKLLVVEEVNELVEAIQTNNRVEVIDALCDIKYINDGTANEMGIKLNDKRSSEFYYSEGGDINTTIKLLQKYTSKISQPNIELVNNFVYKMLYHTNFSLETFNEGLRRVHESNMSKCVDGKVIKHPLTGKVLKPETFIPVNLTDLV